MSCVEEKCRTNFTRFKTLKNSLSNLCLKNAAKYFYQPTDPSSLGIIRFLFGLLMLIDIPEERGGSDIDVRWGNPENCHFPLIPFMKAPPFPYMCLLYGVMWVGALGIMLGYKFRISIFLFGIPYWYIFLLDKSFWNNHSYLYGLVAILLMGSSANHYFSIDGLLDTNIRNKHVPYWNYFILKYQFFMLYFLAGLKKTDMEWLEGYSMSNLRYHWVFIPFRLILSPDQIDYLIVHWFGFLLDLTIGFWMLLEFTRPVAMLFCAMFHLMNSRLFSIGMFPYVCLATMPLFCEENWPRKVARVFCKNLDKPTPSNVCIYSEEQSKIYKNFKLKTKVKFGHKLVTVLLICHCGLQAFLPYSHFITKGYNNWTKGLYGYSWDMMVHSWDTILVVVKVVDNDSNSENFIDSQAWTLNDRWNKHADMCVQYAECLESNLRKRSKDSHPSKSLNISIYVDVWCSLNKRFQQRMYNPNYDLLKANWSPFEPVEWLLPLLSEYNDLRRKINEISNHVHSLSNESEVLFVADFPGLFLENYIMEDLHNVSLTVLEGEVVYEMDDEVSFQSLGIKLKQGDSTPVEVGTFHKIHTVSSTPSCYMYTYYRDKKTDEKGAEMVEHVTYSPFPLIEDVQNRTEAFLRMMEHIQNALMHVLFGKDMELIK